MSESAQAGDGTVTAGGESDSAKPAKREGIGKTFGIVAVLSFLSKFFGLARDIVVLGAFGAAADAYNYACLFTNNILVLFGGLGGPFHSTSVSILSARKTEEAARDLVGQLLFITSASLCAITILMWIFAPQLVALVVPAQELSEPDRLRLWAEIVPILRIMSPMVLIAGLVGLGAGISNSYKEFFWPSLSPAVANIAIIVAVLLWWLVPGVSRDAGAHLAGMAGSCLGMMQKLSSGTGFWQISSILQCFLWMPIAGLLILGVGTLVGAIGQLFVQLPGMMRAKPRFSNFKLTAGLKEYLIMLGPATISTSVGQINVYIDSFFVSSLEPGSMSAIVNANRLIQLPLGVLLTAMLVPILPRFTEQIASGEVEEMKKELSKSLRIVWFLVIPLVTMLLAIPEPIVKLLFERGQFGEEMRYLVVTALMFLVPQAFFYIPRDLVTRAFYAHQDSTTPFRVGMCAIFVKFIANYVLVAMMGMGVGGITLSTTLVTVFNMFLLSHLLRRRIGPLGITRLFRPAIIMLVASGLAG
ncbi:MAG: murein biosynthesis integral membrane protein MurJ, partial [Cyanobacteria bacterium]|nr:murein biosynthesis integral membrane protein MurJ [Cyanobacteriota bacterium]